MLKRFVIFSLLFTAIAGCSSIVIINLDDYWGPQEVRDRVVDQAYIDQTGFPEFHHDIKPIMDNRCVVCHACSDSPCQLNLSSFEGLDRGANKKLVYNGSRLLADQPSRLFIDSKSTSQWRARDYIAVLNDRNQSPGPNLEGSVLYKFLELKKKHPLPTTKILPDSFDFSLARKQQCSPIEGFQSLAKDEPLWGMPFGLKALSEKEFNTIEMWLAIGSPVVPHAPISSHLLKHAENWEAFFNSSGNKNKLVSRYIYEHLFLANLYFDENNPSEQPQFFKLVRSRTPTGVAIDEIASRRPFDDPGTETFFYRLRPVQSTIVDKTHMPYALSPQRMERWRELFFEVDYQVNNLPSYNAQYSANPFRTFKAIPAKSRYQFMLDEAEFTIMGFIKGPVCRGQVALNVIEDHFWVFFVDPDVKQMLYQPNGGEERIDNLRLPAESQSNASPFDIWTTYSDLQEKHLMDAYEFVSETYPTGTEITLDAVWDGEQNNPNAALTVFRHFDSATVVKGLNGQKPKTAWVVSYSLLERIHYLLVAGFDVYGNLGHQLNTRLYMDFLRMEGEATFLALLPQADAKKEFLSWYQGAEDEVEDYISLLQNTGFKLTNLSYQTDNYKNELFDKLKAYLKAPLSNATVSESNIDSDSILAPLENVKGESLQWLPETSIMQVTLTDGSMVPYTLSVNRGHYNVSSMFMEDDNLAQELNTLSVSKGILGSYPNSFLSTTLEALPQLSSRIRALSSETDYRALLDDFGVRRTSDLFWPYVDWIHEWKRTNQPIRAGLIDLNRFENR